MNHLRANTNDLLFLKRGWMSWFVATLISFASTSWGAQTPPATNAWPADNLYQPFKCAGNISDDLPSDASGAQDDKDIVGDANSPAAQFYTTAEYLFVRLRLEDTVLAKGGGEPLTPFGWGFAFDTNRSLTGNGYEYAWIVNGISEEFNFYSYPNGSATKVSTYQPTIHTANPGWVKASIPTGSNFGGNTDGYLDVAIPLDDFKALTATDSNPFSPGRIALWIGTSANGTRLDKDFMCWDDRSGTPDLSTIATEEIGVGTFTAFTDGLDGSIQTTLTPALTGTATPSLSVTVSDGTNSAIITVGTNGSWSFDIPGSWNWSDGNTYTVSTTIAGGNTTSISVPISISGKPVVLIKTPIDQASLTTSTPTFSGSVSGSAISMTVTISDNSATPNSATTSSDASNGSWSFTTPSEWGWAAGQTYTVSASIVSDTETGTLSTHTISVSIQGPPTVSITSPVSPATMNTNTPTISGTTAPNLTVTLCESDPCGTGGSGTATANSLGNWSFTIPESWNWADGQTYTVYASVPQGTQTVQVQISVVLTPPESIAISSPEDNATITTAFPTLTGTTTPLIEVTISDGRGHSGTTTSDANGQWQFVVPKSWQLLSPQSYTFTASTPSGVSAFITLTTLLIDSDGDQIPDDWDNCVYLSNNDQQDDDGDGIGNRCDYGVISDKIDAQISGLRMSGSGCATIKGSNSGLGSVFMIMFFILLVQSIGLPPKRRSSLQGLFRGVLLWLSLIYSSITATAKTTEILDIEMYDAMISGAGVFNQSYGRIEGSEEQWRLGLGFSYSDKPLYLIKTENNDVRSSGAVIPAIARYEFLARKRFQHYYDFTVAIPVVQGHGSPDWLVGGRTKQDIQATTFGDVRLSVGMDLLRWWHKEDGTSPWGLALRLSSWLPTGNVMSFHGESSSRFETRLALDHRRGRNWAGINVGYLNRRRYQVFHLINDDAIRWSFFLRGALYKKADWVASLFGNEQTAEQIDPTDATKTVRSSIASPRETLVGTVFPVSDFEFTLGAGAGLNAAVGSPEYRVVAQIVYDLPIREKYPQLRNEPATQISPDSAIPKEEQRELESLKIYFAFNSYEILSPEIKKLQRAVEILTTRQKEIAFVEVQGHTDIVGDTDFNNDLSLKRSNAVIDYLKKAGVLNTSLKPIGLGQSKPEALEKTVEAQRLNRRVEFVLKLN